MNTLLKTIIFRLKIIAMTTRQVDPNTFRYYTPNYSADIQARKRYIFLGSFSQRPSTQDFKTKNLQELIIKTNFRSKDVIHQLGAVRTYPKTACKGYEWIVIKASVQALYPGFWAGVKITLFLLYIISAALSIGVFSCWVLVHYSYKLSLDNTSLMLLMLLIATGTYHTLKSFWDLFQQHILSVIEQAQQPYRDPFVAFQGLSRIPNSMHGFDMNNLANERTAEGWKDPISHETIPATEISSTQILRIGHYAIPIQSTLQAMLTRNSCPRGEIPHPVENRPLYSDEKTKFLKEVSAFFAIPSRMLENCWKVQVSQQNLEPYISKIRDWHLLPRSYQTIVIKELINRVLPNKRKQHFLRLLPNSIVQSCFDDQFRSTAVTMTDIQETARRVHARQLLQGSLLMIGLVAQLHLGNQRLVS